METWIPGIKKALWISIVAHIFFLPFTITGAQAALTIMLVIQVALFAAERRFDWRRDPLAFPILVFLILTFISVAFSSDPARSFWKTMEAYWVIPAYFVIVSQLHYREDRLLLLLKILVVVSALTAIYANLQHFYGWDMLRFGGNDPRLYNPHGDYYHATGFFDHHLTYGNFVMLILFALIALFFSPVSRSWKFIAVICAVPTLSGFFFSYARGPVLGLFAGSLFYGYLKGKRYLAALLAVCLVVILAFTWASDSLRDRLKSSFTSNMNVERIITWQTTVDLIKDHPYIGVGPGMYRSSIQKYRQGYNVSFTSAAHAHNSYLQIAATGGILTLIPFIWIFVRIFAMGIGRYYNNALFTRLAREALLGALAAMVAFGFAGLFQNNFGDAEVLMLMWVFAAMIMRKAEKDQNEKVI